MDSKGKKQCTIPSYCNHHIAVSWILFLKMYFFSNIPYVIYYERYEIHTIECTLSNQSSLLQM